MFGRKTKAGKQAGKKSGEASASNDPASQQSLNREEQTDSSSPRTNTLLRVLEPRIMLDAALADNLVDAHAPLDRAAFTNHPDEKTQDDYHAAELLKGFVPPASLNSPASLAAPQESEAPTSGSQPPAVQGDELDPNASSSKTETNDASLSDDQAFGVAMLGSTLTPTLEKNTGLEVKEGRTVTITEDQLKGDWAETEPETISKWGPIDTFPFVGYRDVEVPRTDFAKEELIYTVTALPDHGSLKLNGQELEEGQSFTQQDIANGVVTYHHDGSENYHDNFKFTLTDSGDTNAAPLADQTFNFAVSPVNDAPTLTKQTLTISEGGSVAITSTELSAADDDDAAPQLIYKLIEAPAYGTLKFDGQVLGVGDTFTQADINSGQLEYENDGSEKSFDSFRFTLTDHGGTSVADGAQIFAIDVSPVNDAPTLSGTQSLSVDEGATKVIRSSELNGVDAEDASDELTYTVTELPTEGTLKVDSTTLNLQGTFTQTQINANELSYTHNGGENHSDEFKFTLADNGNPRASLTDGEQTFEINVNPVNDVPTLSGTQSLNVDEGAWAKIPDSLLSASDADHGPNDLVYTVAALPEHGILRRSGWPLLLNGTFTQVDIESGNITYVHDGSENHSDGFKFTLADNGNPPAALADGEQTFAINVNPVNDAPTLTKQTLTISEGGSVAITSTELSATDDDDVASQLIYKLIDAPAYGTLKFYGQALAANATFTQADINAGRISYEHHGSENNSDSFRFTLADDGGESLAGGEQIFSILVNQVNDAPTLSGTQSLNVDEGGTKIIGPNELTATDAEDGSDVLTYRVWQLPTQGTLALGGTTLNLHGTFTQAQIKANELSYTHNGSENHSDEFKFTLADNGNPPAGLAGGEQTFAINVNPVNDAPTLSGTQSLNVDEGGTKIIGSSELNATDSEDSSGALTYTVTELPTEGTLKLDGAPLTLQGTFTQADIPAGRLTYEHSGNEEADDSFTFTLADAQGKEIAGSPRTFNITVTPVNDAPTLSGTQSLVVEEGTAKIIGSSELNATDSEDGSGELTYTVTELPTEGTLRLDGAPLTLQGTFTQADISASRLTYDHSGNEEGDDSFTFTLADAQGKEIAGSPRTFNITVTPVNDAPVINSGQTYTFSAFAENTASESVVVSVIVNDPTAAFNYSDQENQALAGIALVGNAATDEQGTWQYSTDGNNYTDIPTDLDSGAALGLSGATELRFKPANNYTGAVGNLTFVVLDASGTIAFSNSSDSGSNSTLDVATHSSSAAFSQHNGTIAIASPVDDLPTGNGNELLSDLNLVGGSPDDLTLSGSGNTLVINSDQPQIGITAIYNAETNTLTVEGGDFVSIEGSNNDIDVSKLTITGAGAVGYTLTSDNVEIDSDAKFTVTLNSADRTAVESLLNKAGADAADSTEYNLAIEAGFNGDESLGDLVEIYVEPVVLRTELIDAEALKRVNGDIEVLKNSDSFGRSVTSIGDLNNDGVNDLAVGADGDSEWRGALHILFMKADGTVDSIKTIKHGTPITGGSKTVLSLEKEDLFGVSVANLGDLDNDGVNDLVVGASGDSNKKGGVYILFMNSNGSVKDIDTIDHNDDNNLPLDDSVGFGASVTNIGDLDDNGFDDLAVGASGNARGRGAVYILFMEDGGSVEDAVKIDHSTINGPLLNPDDRFGSSVTNIGDLDGNGFDDLAVGAINDDAGAVHILLMDTRGAVETTVKIDSSSHPGLRLSDGDFFGISIANMGDLNNDKVNDLAVGAFKDDAGGPSAAGAVHILYMRDNGTVKHTVKIDNAVASLVLAENNNFGVSLANIGDVNGGGLPDLAVGAFGTDYVKGALHIIYLDKSAPLVDTNTGITVSDEDDTTPIAIDIGELEAIDPDDGANPIPANLTYTLEKVPTHGKLTLLGGDDGESVWTASAEGGPSNDTFTQADINEGKLIYTPEALDDRSYLTDNFKFKVTDAHGLTTEEKTFVIYVDPAVIRTNEINHTHIIDTNGNELLAGGDSFGRSVASIGDLNNDGVEDFAIGAHYADSKKGAVHILFMNADGTVKNTAKIDSSALQEIGLNIQAQDYFGVSVTSLGDVNNDGVNDLAVGATGYSGSKGALYILFMKSNGSVESFERIDPANNNNVLINDAVNFGYSVANIGDLDDNGFDDLAVGAVTGVTGNDDDAGAVYILFMKQGGLVERRATINDATVNGPSISAGDHFGNSVTNIGDVDGDGLNDLAVGAYRSGTEASDAGAVHILLMDSDGKPKETVEINGITVPALSLEKDDSFGVSVANLGDLDGDGINDLAVGAHGDDGSGSDSGAVYILYMGEKGTVRHTVKIDSNVTSLGLAANNYFGVSLANIGDVNGGGLNDLAVGAFGADAAKGALHIIYLDNSAPLVETNTGMTVAGSGTAPIPITNSMLNAKDPDDAEETDQTRGELKYTLTALPTHGTLILTADDGNDGDNGWDTSSGNDLSTYTFTQADINDGHLTYTPNEGDRNYLTDNFKFKVADAHGLATTKEHAFYITPAVARTELIDAATLSEVNGDTEVLKNKDYFGRSVTSIGDLNNDGVEDFAVGAHHDKSKRGAIHILFMSADGSVDSIRTIGGAEIEGASENSFSLVTGDFFGASVANLGDLNDDGVNDLAVGAEGDSDAKGAVYILFMETNGDVKAVTKIDADSDGNILKNLLANKKAFGIAITKIGDPDPAGNIQLAVGAEGNSVSNGAVYILDLNKQGKVEKASEITGATVNGLSIRTNDRFGSSVTDIGDIDGDGLNDLAVGAFRSDTGATDAGAVHILLMDAEGKVRETVEINGATVPTLELEEGDYFGVSVTNMGDLNNDGFVDLAVGAFGDDESDTKQNAGAVYILYMGEDATVKHTVKIDSDAASLGLAADNNFGVSVANIGDANGGGLNDLAVGAYGADSKKGALYIIYLDNSAPLVTTNTGITVEENHAENTPITIRNGLLNAKDPDDSDKANLTYTLEKVPTHGKLILTEGDGSDRSVWDTSPGNDPSTYTFTQADINNNRLKYIPEASADRNYLTDNFKFKVADAHGLTAQEQTFVIYVEPVVLRSEQILPDPATFKVFSNSHATSNNPESAGRYFNFRLEEVQEVLGRPLFHGEQLEVRNVRTDKTGQAVFWNNTGGVEDEGYGSGRFHPEGEAIQNDWWENDVVELLADGPLPNAGDRFGRSVASIGDLNNDGVDDLAVGAHYTDSHKGAVYLLFMKADGTVKNTAKIDSSSHPNLSSLDDRDFFGVSIANMGDLNKDGVNDLVVGASGDSNRKGSVYILYMNSNGSAKHVVKIDSSHDDIDLKDDDSFGVSVANIGDLNNDGIDDLAVGASSEDESTEKQKTGAVHILFMKDDGSVDSAIKINGAIVSALGLEEDDYFGDSVANIGDLDGNGFDELAVGAHRDDESDVKLNTGAVHILFMGADGAVLNTVEINGNTVPALDLEKGDRFGSSVANLGDLNGDGNDDLAVGASGVYNSETEQNAGAVHILYMGEYATVKHTVKIDTPVAPGLGEYNYFGASLANIGDVNGGGLPDLAVGATGADADKGALHIIYLDNSAPLVDTNTGMTVAGSGTAPIPITNSMLNAKDPDDGDKANLTYTLETVPNYGTLRLSETVLTDFVEGGPSTYTFTQDDIDNDRLTYTPNEDDRNYLTDNFKFTVTDAHGLAVEQTFYITPAVARTQLIDATALSEVNGNNQVLNDGDYFGRSVTSIGDLNNDGVEDFAVGAHLADSQKGAVHILFMKTDGTVDSAKTIGEAEIGGASENALSLETGDSFGASVVNLGDLNDDGVNDLAVGAEGDSDEKGAVYILFMETNGDVKALTKIDADSDVNIFKDSLADKKAFGVSITKIGNPDPAGNIQLAVGALGNSVSNGAVYILDLNKQGEVEQAFEITDVTVNGPSIGTDDCFGSSVTDIGDIDGDGLNDLAVGAFRSERGATITGAVHILLMDAEGKVKETVEINGITVPALGLEKDDYFGVSVANLGDLNDDGFVDLAVGASGVDKSETEPDTGAVYILYMGEKGAVKHAVKIDASNYPSLSSNDKFGLSLANIGDVNGGGLNDLAVGAPSADSRSGALHIIYLDNSAPLVETNTGMTVGDSSTDPIHITDDMLNAKDPDDAEETDQTLRELKYTLTAVPTHGTLKLDGSELLVGSIFTQADINEGKLEYTPESADDRNYLTDNFKFKVTDAHGLSTQEQTFVIYVDPAVIRTNEINHTHIKDAGGDELLVAKDYFGRSVTSIGDLNNDGVEDFAVGAHHTDSQKGVIHILFMKADGTVDSIRTIGDGTEIVAGDKDSLSIETDDLFGNSVANLGDIDGNGINDLAVSAHGSHTREGFVYILFMQSNGSVESVTKIDKPGNNEDTSGIVDVFGESVANIGDLNSDGVNDLAVGASGDSGEKGAVYILFMKDDGSVDSAIKINNATSNGPSLNPDDLFGHSVANMGDIDGNGINDLAVGAPLDSNGEKKAGVVHILLMGPNGAVIKTVEINDAIVPTLGLEDGDRFGISVANMGDLNDDGFDDLAVGAFHDDESNVTKDTGAVYILYMGEYGSVKHTVKIDNAGDSLVLGQDDNFGISVANIGDVNGGGLNDLAVGAYGAYGKKGALHIIYLDNSAPQIDAESTYTFALGAASIPKSVNEIVSDSVAAFNLRDNDADSALGGIAITHNAAIGTQGVWQYNTVTDDNSDAKWEDVPTDLTSIQALALSATTQLRFKAEKVYDGPVGGLTFVVVDDTYTGGYSDSTLDEPNTTLVIASTPYTFVDFTEGEAEKTVGSMVADVRPKLNLSGHAFSDPAGVAITGNTVSAKQGVWQYNTVTDENSGPQWVDIPAEIISSQALVLSAGTQLRFNANENYDGALGELSFVVLDTLGEGEYSNSSNPSTLDASSIHTGAFSQNTGAISGTVRPMPKISGFSTDPITYTEDQLEALNLASALEIEFAEGKLQEAVVVIENYVAAEDEFKVGGVLLSKDTDKTVIVPDDSLSTDIEVSAAEGEASGIKTLTVTFRATDESGATAAEFQTVLQTLTYANQLQSPTETAREVTLTVKDSSGADADNATSAESKMTLEVLGVNDAPRIDAERTYTFAGFVEDLSSQSASIKDILANVGAAFNLQDEDVDSSLGGIAITTNSAVGEQGAWYYSTDQGSTYNVIEESVSDSAALVLSASTQLAFAPAENYTGAVGSLTFVVLDDTYSGEYSGSVASELDVSLHGSTGAFSQNSGTIAWDPATVELLGDDAKTGAEAASGDGVVRVEAEAGSTVEVVFTGTGEVKVTKTIESAQGTAETITLTATEVEQLGDGAVSVVTTVTDAAGNTSSVGGVEFTLDTIAPAEAVVSVIGDGEFTVNEAEQGVVTVEAESGAGVVVVFTGTTGADQAVTKSIDGTGTAETIKLTASEVEQLGDGAVSVVITVTDAAGNESTHTASELFALDTSAPAEALVTVVGDGQFTVAEAETQGVVTVAAEPGSTVEVEFTGTGGEKVTKSIDGTGTAETIELTAEDVTTLGDGAVSVVITVTDAAGNESTHTMSELFALDTSVPAEAVVSVIGDAPLTLDEAENAGVVTVEAEPGSSVEVELTGTNGVVTESFTASEEAETITLTTTQVEKLGDGAVSVVTTVTDVAGNAVGPTVSEVSFVLDTSVPDTALVTMVGDGQITLNEAVNDGVLTVDAEAGSTVEVEFSVGDKKVTKSITGNGTPETIKLTASEIDGLGDGAVSVVTTVKDVAGNVSIDTASELFTLDTSAPAEALVTVVGDGQFTVAEAETLGVLSVAAEPGSSVEVEFTGTDGVVSASFTASEDAETITLTTTQIETLGDGVVSVKTAVTDVAGNVAGPTASEVSFALDVNGFKLANIEQRAFDWALGDGSAPPSLSDYQSIGVQGLNADNLDTFNLLVSSANDAGVAIDSVAKLNASASIVDLADGSATITPNAASYAQLGLNGVDDQNVGAMNALLASAGDTGIEINSFVELNALASIVDLADGSAAITPNAASYAQLGLNGIDDQNVGVMNALLASAGDTGIEINSFAELNALAKIVDLADGATTITPNAASYAQLGLSSIDDQNVGAMNALLASAGDAGIEINSFAELNALASIVDLADGATTITPNAASYAQLGLNGIDDQNVGAMNALLASAGDAGKEINSFAELNALASIVDLTDGTAVITPNAASYAQLGLNGIDDQNVGVMNALLASAGDTGLVIDSLAELNALAKIVDLSDGDALSVPTIEDFALLNITGVDDSNINEIAQVIAESHNDDREINSLDNLQLMVNALNRVFDGSPGTVEPTADDFMLIGIKGVELVAVADVHTLIASVRASGVEVATLSAVQGLVRILDQADGEAAITPNAASYAALGLSGIDDQNVDATNALLVSAVDAGIDATSIAVLNALAKIVDHADGQTDGALTINDFVLLGIFGVNESNINEVTQAIAESANDGSGIHSLAKIQTLVDPFLAPIPTEPAPKSTPVAVEVLGNASSPVSASSADSSSTEISVIDDLTTGQSDRVATFNEPVASSGIVSETVRAVIKAQSDINSQTVDAFDSILPNDNETLVGEGLDAIAERRRLVTPLDEIIDSAFSVVLAAGMPAEQSDNTLSAVEQRRRMSPQTNVQAEPPVEDAGQDAVENTEVTNAELPEDGVPVASLEGEGWRLQMEKTRNGFEQQRQHLAEIAGSSNVA